MKKWEVLMEVAGFVTVEVDAETEGQASGIAITSVISRDECEGCSFDPIDVSNWKVLGIAIRDIEVKEDTGEGRH